MNNIQPMQFLTVRDLVGNIIFLGLVLSEITHVPFTCIILP